MSAIGKGDFDEKVGDSVTAPVIAARTLTRVSRIGSNDVGVCPDGHVGPPVYVELTGNRRWCHCAWKLAYRPKPDAISELLKAPTDAPTKEPVAA